MNRPAVEMSLRQTLRRSSVFRFVRSGAPEKIRTPNLLIRSQMLYPIELRARIGPGWPASDGCATIRRRPVAAKGVTAASSRGRNLADPIRSCKGSGARSNCYRHPPANP
jgi:hypothetical protein